MAIHHSVEDKASRDRRRETPLARRILKPLSRSPLAV